MALMREITAPPVKPLTPRELATELKTSIPTALQWYHDGIIPAVVAIGRTYRFDLVEVRQALAAHSNRGVAR